MATPPLPGPAEVVLDLLGARDSHALSRQGRRDPEHVRGGRIGEPDRQAQQEVDMALVKSRGREVGEDHVDEAVGDLDRVAVAQRLEERLVLFAEDHHERTHRSGPPTARVGALAGVDDARHGEEPHVVLQFDDLAVLDELVELVDDVEPQVAVAADWRRRHQAQLRARELVPPLGWYLVPSM